MAVLLALGGAIAYGLSDFIGGLASRRTSVWPVAFLACLGAMLGSLVLAVAVPGDPEPVDYAWAALGGLGSGIGTAFLYRGLSRGRMGVVAPVSAVGAALIPVAFGVLTGERPTPLVWLGIVAAAPGIWLVSKEDAGEFAGEPTGTSGLLDGVLAGVGFGVLFAALGQVPTSAGYWPLAVNQLLSLVAVSVSCVLLGGSPVPRDRTALWGLVAGVLASLAVLGFLLATERGLLSVSAVLTSLYPAATVLLAAVVLKEHIHRIQSVGLALCAVTVVCVALG
jgi:drug/metabolite transporter (DMT)-like permease